jgi:hypothetical protein
LKPEKKKFSKPIVVRPSFSNTKDFQTNMNPNTNQQHQNDMVNQDPMYYKACKVACTLVEVTERFLATINDLQQLFNNQNYSNINNPLKQLLEQYEHVGMIVNVLKSIYPFINNLQHQNSLAIATKSAATTSLNSLSRLFDLANSSLQNTTVDAMTLQTLAAIRCQILQSTAENDNEFGTQTVKLEPANDPKEIERKELELKRMQMECEKERQELELKRQQLEREKEEFQKKMLLSSPITVKTENNNEIPEGLQEQLQIQNNLQSLVISSSQFLKQFEMTASNFAALNHMSVDRVWESMFVYALPGDKAEWAKKNIFGRDFSWNDAKKIYLRHFPDTASTSPTPPPPVQPPVQLKQKTLPPITNPKANLRRVARYAEYLLSLEMKANDEIDEYNARYLRHSRCAQMDLNDTSLIRRYCNSLLPQYRNLLAERLKTSPVSTLEGVTSLASSIAKANPTATSTKYTQNCTHNRNMLKVASANQDTTYRPPSPSNDDGTGKGQKREFMGSPSSSSLRSKRPTVF